MLLFVANLVQVSFPEWLPRFANLCSWLLLLDVQVEEVPRVDILPLGLEPNGGHYDKTDMVFGGQRWKVKFVIRLRSWMQDRGAGSSRLLPDTRII